MMLISGKTMMKGMDYAPLNISVKAICNSTLYIFYNMPFDINSQMVNRELVVVYTCLLIK